jgi:signal peptidase I
LSNTEPIVVVENAAPSVPTPRPQQAATNQGLLPSIQSLLATVIIAVFVISFVVQAFQIPSESMEDTLLIGDYLLVNKLRYGGQFGRSVVPYERVKRGDIIVFHYPVNPSQHFVKRVIGVPGDHVRLVNRQVWVNGLPMKESYVRYALSNHDVYRDDFPQVDYIAPGEEPLWFKQQKQVVQQGELVVPNGQYFVMGDNRDMSLDSRYWGFVPRENIIGTPLLIYWSIRSTDELIGPNSGSDKLFRFAYAVTHLFQMTRWDRTFRLVH